MSLRRTVKVEQPVLVTISFLDPRDVLKLMQLNRKLRQLFLGNMATFPTYRGLFERKVKDLSTEVEEKQEAIRGHERNISFLREQDNLRLALMNETPEEYIKQIIEKHVVKPKFEKNEKAKQKKSKAKSEQR